MPQTRHKPVSRIKGKSTGGKLPVHQEHPINSQQAVHFPDPELFESAVVGCFLKSPQSSLDELAKAGENLDPSFFHSERCKLILRQALERHGRGLLLGLIEITKSLEKSGELKKVGGPSFLSKLFTELGSVPESIAYDFQDVKQLAAGRAVHGVQKRLADAVKDQRTTVIDFEAILEQSLKSLETFRLKERSSAGCSLDEILLRVRRFLCDFIVFPKDEQAAIIALWIVHTWVIDAYQFTPYLSVQSPVKRCGKTTLLECLRLLVRLPWSAVNPSPAVLYRKIQQSCPSLLLDEVDTIFSVSGSDTGKEDIRGLLNAGFQRGATVPRCVGND